jgi:hypothetical protein
VQYDYRFGWFLVKTLCLQMSFLHVMVCFGCNRDSPGGHELCTMHDIINT